MLLALAVTLLAGLSTCLGGLLGVRSSVVRPGVLAAALAFAAGLMLAISLLQIAPASVRSLSTLVDPSTALASVLGVMALGATVVLALGRLLPHGSGHVGAEAATPDVRGLDPGLLRSGVLIALVVGLHNLPEGLATFVSTLEDPAGGLVLAVGIAIHNVPEGLAVAAPIYAATRSRSQALLWATLSGLAEPLGGLLGYRGGMPSVTARCWSASSSARWSWWPRWSCCASERSAGAVALPATDVLLLDAGDVEHVQARAFLLLALGDVVAAADEVLDVLGGQRRTAGIARLVEPVDPLGDG
ncbi:MAG: hypothetical protein DI571_12040, partial [Arsenicicoccus sp.]